MAKNWYDSAAPTMELGGLLGMPDMRLTDEDKKRAFWQALMQGGMGMAAASLGGANTAQSLGKGLLGGADAYGQGLQAPMARFHQAKEQLDFQGKQLGNAKNYAELQQQQNLQRLLGGVGNVTANPFQMEAQGNGAVGIGPLAPDSPEMQQGAMRAQASLFNNPAFLAKLAANGMKGSDISALGGRFDPQKRDAGAMYQNPVDGSSFVVPNYSEGWQVQNGRKMAVPGQTDFLKGNTSATEAAKAEFDLTNIPQSDGTSRMMSRADYLRQQQTEPQVFNVGSEAEAQALAKMLDKTGVPFSVRVAGQGAPSLGVTANPVSQAEAKGIAEGRVKRMNDIVEKVGPAQQTVQQMDYALKNMPRTGQFAPEAKLLAGAMSYAGIATEQQQKMLQDMGVFNNAVLDAMLNKAKPLKPISNDEIKMIEDRLGTARADPKNARLTLAMTRAVANLEAQKGDFIRRYGEDNGSYKGAEKAWEQSQGSTATMLFTDPAMQEFNPRRQAKGPNGIVELQELPNGLLFNAATGQLIDPKKKVQK